MSEIKNEYIIYDVREYSNQFINEMSVKHKLDIMLVCIDGDTLYHDQARENELDEIANEVSLDSCIIFRCDGYGIEKIKEIAKELTKSEENFLLSGYRLRNSLKLVRIIPF